MLHEYVNLLLLITLYKIRIYMLKQYFEEFLPDIFKALRTMEEY